MCIPSRNLYYRRRPWCYFMKNQQLVWEYCSIPQCDSQSCMWNSFDSFWPSFFMSVKCIPFLHLQLHLHPHPLIHSQVASSPDRTHHVPCSSLFFTINPFLSPSCGVHLWPPYQEEADEDCWWNRGHYRIPPLGRCHFLAKQEQGECFSVWRESDLGMLGPDRCPLLSWRVGSDATHCIAAGAESARLINSGFSPHSKSHRFSVVLGKNALNESDSMEQTFKVEKIILHEGFNNSEGNFNNDIGMTLDVQL